MLQNIRLLFFTDFLKRIGNYCEKHKYKVYGMKTEV